MPISMPKRECIIRAKEQVVARKVGPIVRCCKSCGLWDIESAKDKAGRVRKDTVVRCLWKMEHPLPDSVSAYGMPLRVEAGFMPASCGTKCQCWVDRTSNTEGLRTRHFVEGTQHPLVVAPNLPEK